MDDPFGCLQGVKISSKMMQEILQKRNELHLCPLSNRINRCPSCKEQLVYVVNEFCRECPKCCRVFECDDDEQFQEENRGRSSTAPPTSNFHLKNVFRKWNIDKMFSSSEIAFLGKVIAQFQEITGKSVNYPCFLHNYFEMVPSERWPHKKKLWNLFLITFLKPLKAGGAQNRSLKIGGALLQAQPQLLFQIVFLAAA